MFGIEMKVRSGRESELRPGLSKAEKKACANWSMLSRQTHLYSTADSAQRAINKMCVRYPHMEYRVAAL
jgi:hypothetical protein